MMAAIAYCGTAPVPGALLGRWNLDPWLLAALAVIAALHIARLAGARQRSLAAAGWGVAALALLSPLCALSVALFSARVAQHMILILLAAPLIAMAWPKRRPGGGAPSIALTSGSFAILLWAWHMPGPYDATFTSTPLYWAMHVSLFGSAILLWRELLHADGERLLLASAAGLFSSMQMGLLGAVLALAPVPLFRTHLLTSGAWGYAPLVDQQLGGLLMWVPGGLGFLVLGLAGVARLLRPADQGTSSAGNA